jgi:AcrR family transcriptional regulator
LRSDTRDRIAITRTRPDPLGPHRAALCQGVEHMPGHGGVIDVWNTRAKAACPNLCASFVRNEYDGHVTRSDAPPTAVGRPRVPGLTKEILDATIMLVAECGVDGLTLDAIADRAGVGRPTIYRRWRSKEALLEAAIEVIVDEQLAPPNVGNIRDNLIELARRMIDQLQTPMASLWTVYFDLERAHLAPAAFRRARESNMQMVQHAIELGELRPGTDAKILQQLIFGILWYRVNVAHEYTDPDFAVVIIDMLLEPLRNSP